MSAPLLRCLFLEDNENDAFIVARELRPVATLDVARGEDEFRDKLKAGQFDVILLDFSLPRYNGEEAMALVKQICPDTPTILVTGSINDHSASAYLRSGASDYLLKDRLSRLPEAVKRAHENSQLRRQALRDNRLELIGHMQAGFNHDLRNLLQVFVSGTDILRKLVRDHVGDVPADIARVLDAMASTGVRGTEMSVQISAFVRGSNGSNLKVVTPEYLLTELGAMLRDSFPKNVRLTLHTTPGTGRIKCDVTQVIQLLLNIAVNGRDAMGAKGGELVVTAQNTTLTEGSLQGEFVVLQVRDTGPGIPVEHLADIWQPFWTSKPLSQGTGLGLPMALKIAKDHGGDIDVKTGSAGTSFYVYFPVAQEETRAEKVTRMDEFDGRGATVLIVDDESHMRMLVEIFLRDAGYKPLVASSGMEALSYFRSNTQIGVLLTDCGMPVLSGQQLAEALRGQGHALPIVFMTGATEAEFDPAPDSILRKPFTRDALLKALQEALDSTRSSATLAT